jgi:hypothetical protein
VRAAVVRVGQNGAGAAVRAVAMVAMVEVQ